MHSTKLRKVGGSVMLAIPPAVLEALGLSAEKSVGLRIVDGELVVKPTRRRYTLDELLDQCAPDAPVSEEDRIFLDSVPVGRELI